MNDFDALAAAPIDDTDLEVLARAARLFDALDPMPPRLPERIAFGLTLDALEAEVAELQRVGELTGVRADAGADVQSVTFTSSTLTTMVTITPAAADHVRIDGWVAPGGGVHVELRIVDQTLETTADSDGRFVFGDVPRGLAQFVLRPPSGSSGPVVTPSLEI